MAKLPSINATGPWRERYRDQNRPCKTHNHHFVLANRSGDWRSPRVPSNLFARENIPVKTCRPYSVVFSCSNVSGGSFYREKSEGSRCAICPDYGHLGPGCGAKSGPLTPIFLPLSPIPETKGNLRLHGAPVPFWPNYCTLAAAEHCQLSILLTIVTKALKGRDNPDGASTTRRTAGLIQLANSHSRRRETGRHRIPTQTPSINQRRLKTRRRTKILASSSWVTAASQLLRRVSLAVSHRGRFQRRLSLYQSHH